MFWGYHHLRKHPPCLLKKMWRYGGGHLPASLTNLMYVLFVKLVRDRKYECSSQRVVKSKGNSWTFQGNLFRLVKYIIPFGQMDCIWIISCSRLKTQFHTTEVDFGSVPATCSHHGPLAGVCISVYAGCEPKDQMNHTTFEQIWALSCNQFAELGHPKLLRSKNKSQVHETRPVRK